MAGTGEASVWVITLDRAADRRARMAEALDATGLAYAFVPAVDGRALGPAELARYDRAARLARFHADLRPNEIACYLSHLGCIRAAWEAGRPRVLILEDDVRPGPDFARLVGWCLALPQGYDLIRLYGARRRRGKTVARIDATYRLIRPYNVTSSAAAYLVDREGMRKILAFGDRIVMQFDCMIDRYWESGLRIFAVDPYPASHFDVPSTIGDRPAEPARGLGLKARKAGDSVRKRLYTLGIALGLL